MENLLHSHKTHIPQFFFVLFFILHFSSLQFLSSAYVRPDKYFLNCGSDADANLDKFRHFRGDSDFFYPEDSKDAKASSFASTSTLLYQTARIFKKEHSYYKFNITETGNYLIRIHFFPFSSSSSNLSTALFDVSAFPPQASSSAFELLKNFTANSSNSNLTNEFFLHISPGLFKLVFTPHASSFAFVNAIEVFLAPSDFHPENYQIRFPLALAYRVNVGGESVEPSGDDEIGRSWETDDKYLSDPNSANKCIASHDLRYTEYNSTGFFVPDNQFVAPAYVYKTAKHMSSKSTNITWSFNVASYSKSKYLVRLHFFDIVGNPGNIEFNLSSNGIFVKNIGGPESSFNIKQLPFYYDFVVKLNESEAVAISLTPTRDTDTVDCFLNGLEMFEIMEGSSFSVPPDSMTDMKDSKKVNVGVVVGFALGGLFLICVVAAGVLFGLRYRKEKKVENSEWSPMPSAFGGGSTHSRFTDGTVTSSPMTYLNLGLKIPFAELQHATDNFDKRLLIGEGGFGNVYRGTLMNGRKVAIKRGKREGQGSGQGLPEFETEIMVLSKIRHRHLVSLIGYCDERSEMILVYEFMEKGSLRDHLYDSNLPGLSWKQRLDICIGAARGLHYLHKGAAGGIIHRDVKPTNILLDENFVAKVADFGLSKSGPLDETHVSTNVKGTFGYLDPEYMMSQQLTEKSDVYSFGVVLLEVLSARSAIDGNLPREQMNLAEWGMHCKKEGLLEQFIDASLKGQIDPSSLRKFSETAEKCLQEDANDRPTMGDVLWDLEYALQLQQTAKHREPHEDSTATTSSAFVLQGIERFPSLSSMINRYDVDLSGDDDESDTRGNDVFSQLKIGDAR